MSNEKTYPHYFKQLPEGVTHVDVYLVLEVYGVSNAGIAHAVKKLLCSGTRGSKGWRQDIVEARASLDRVLEIADAWENGGKAAVSEPATCSVPSNVAHGNTKQESDDDTEVLIDADRKIPGWFIQYRSHMQGSAWITLDRTSRTREEAGVELARLKREGNPFYAYRCRKLNTDAKQSEAAIGQEVVLGVPLVRTHVAHETHAAHSGYCDLPGRGY